MIIDTHYSGTNDYIGAQVTAISYRDVYFFNLETTYKKEQTEQLIKKNANQATKTLILLTRNFKTYTRQTIKKIKVVLKIQFSKSGYLPKRIRRLRKNK